MSESLASIFFKEWIYLSITKKRAIPSKNAFFVCILTVFPPLYVKRAYCSRRSLLFDLWIHSFGIKIYPVNLQKRSTGTIWSFLWSNRSFDHRKTPTWFSFLAQAFCFCKSTHPILSLIRIRSIFPNSISPPYWVGFRHPPRPPTPPWWIGSGI